MNNAAAFLVDSSWHPIYKHKTFVQVGMTSSLERKSLDKVCEWLEDERFPDSVVSTFRGKETCKNMYFAVVNLSCVWTRIIKPYVTFVHDLCSEQDLDGSAIAFGLGTTPSPDWLKNVVPALGLRLKVHNALRSWNAAGKVSSVCSL